MSNSTRNTIVLAVLLVLLSTFWAIKFGGMVKKTSKIIASNKIATAAIDSMTAELMVIDSLRQAYRLHEALVSQQSKLIIGKDTPTITYGYLLNILNWKGLNINYDFAATDSQATQGNYHEYIISGSSNYTNLLNFTHQIENQRAVVTIEDLAIGSEGVAKADTVSFSMVLHTHYYDAGPEANELTMKTMDPPYTGYSLFKPRISEEIMPFDIDPSLLNTDDAKLIGITRGMAFFRDAQGIIRILTRGSPVAYGYLHKIDEFGGKVIFRLAKYGLEEDFTVSLNKKQ